MSEATAASPVYPTVAAARLPLGAPGVRLLREPSPPPLSPQRMDVACFVGVAPRGPASAPVVAPGLAAGVGVLEAGRAWRRGVPVAVSSFDAYRVRFGGFEGPGLLPHAVAAFFEQGGRRAHVLRIAARDIAGIAPAFAGCARAAVTGPFTAPIVFVARDPGVWGEALTVSIGFALRPLAVVPEPAGTLLLDRAADAPVGTTLLLNFADSTQGFAIVEAVTPLRDPGMPVLRWQATLAPVPAQPVGRIAVVEARVDVADGVGGAERFDALALDPRHPRWLAAVLCDESHLVWPHKDWSGSALAPASTALAGLRASHPAFAGGEDGYGDITPADFFDDEWSPAAEAPGEGIAALALVVDATQVVVPDLYVPAVWAVDATPPPPLPLGGARFGACADPAPPPSADAVPPSVLTGLILDPRREDELAEIAGLQRRVLGFCEATAELIALFDMPPGLTRGQQERWRAGFDSAWCAAYHPWLRGSRRSLGAVRPLPPSAIAAGIIARTEFARGIQDGPANEPALGVLAMLERVPASLADAFHPIGINVFQTEPGGVRLIGARTLSREREWRQLSVRRLVLMLRRTLRRELQWAVFEPDGPKLRRDLRHAIEQLLRRLFNAGAFAGATEAEAFFVRPVVDRHLSDAAQMLVEIGVAPAEPIEFLLLRLRRNGDGTLGLEG